MSNNQCYNIGAQDRAPIDQSNTWWIEIETMPTKNDINKIEVKLLITITVATIFLHLKFQEILLMIYSNTHE